MPDEPAASEREEQQAAGHEQADGADPRAAERRADAGRERRRAGEELGVPVPEQPARAQMVLNCSKGWRQLSQ